VDLTVWRHLDPRRVVSIHQHIGPDLEEKLARPALRPVIRLVISEHPMMDVHSEKRAMIQGEIEAKRKVLLERDGFLVEDVALRDVRFTPESARAIEAKTIAQRAA